MPGICVDSQAGPKLQWSSDQLRHSVASWQYVQVERTDYAEI